MSSKRKSDLTKDEDNPIQESGELSPPTSGSEDLLLSPKPTNDVEQLLGNTAEVFSLIPNVEEISEGIGSIDFTDPLVSSNLPEKIIIALDRAKYEDITPFLDKVDNDYTPLSLLKKAVEMFVSLKTSINKHHEFALVLLNENKASWYLNFTNNIKEIIKALNAISECEAEDIFDLNSLFTEIDKKIVPPDFCEDNGIPPPYIVRTILFYSRSYTCPQVKITSSIEQMLAKPYFTLDIVVSHDPIGSTNNCEKIFFILQNIDKKGYSYFFAVGRDIGCLMRSVAKLLGHPLQRPIQRSANYSFT